jgi:hypothetical protein
MGTHDAPIQVSHFKYENPPPDPPDVETILQAAPKNPVAEKQAAGVKETHHEVNMCAGYDTLATVHVLNLVCKSTWYGESRLRK